MIDYEIDIDEESVKLASEHGNSTIKQMVLETVPVHRAVKLNNVHAIKARINQLEVANEDIGELYKPAEISLETPLYTLLKIRI